MATTSKTRNWTKEELDLLRERYGQTWNAGAVLAQELGISKGIVQWKARQLGLFGLKATIAKSARHDYFSVVDTPTKAYILGLLAADGHISQAGAVELSLHPQDEVLVRLVRDELSPGSNLRHYQYGGKPPTVRFTLGSEQMVRDLAAFGVVPQKTYSLTWPAALDSNLHRAFLLGYFDGDGSYHWASIGRGYKVESWSIVGTETMIRAASDVVENGCGQRLSISRHTRSHCAFYLKAKARKARSVNDWLHADGLGLERKRVLPPKPERKIVD